MYKLPLVLVFLSLVVFTNRTLNNNVNISSSIHKLAFGGWHNISLDTPVVKEAIRDYRMTNPDIDNHELVKAEIQIVAGTNLRLYTLQNESKFVHTMHRTLRRNAQFYLLKVYQQNKL